MNCLLGGLFGLFSAGAIGSAIMLLPSLLAGSRETRRAAGLAVLNGWLVGLGFIFMPCAYFGLVGLWQVCVGLGLSVALGRENIDLI